MNRKQSISIIFFWVLCFAMPALAQDAIITNRIWDPTIKTVELRNSSDLFAPPVLVLGADNVQLSCSFDDLKGSIHHYAYTVVHCNANWTPSRLWPNEYINGITEERISDAKPSFGTRVAYTHYAFQLPSSSMQFTRSGNYLLKVYDESNPSTICFTLRFYVVEPLSSVTGTVSKSSSIEQRDAYQEVDFQVTAHSYLIDPRSNVCAYILQNGREDDAIRLRPKQVVGS
ncbi:MAG: DUF5103 domain-containing protein, partial [Bacteroidota bacterium]|nr:DUF5103 domain-containing protein [Bacteroidota bacterium]